MCLMTAALHFSPILYELLPGHGEHNGWRCGLGLPQAHASGPGALHPRHAPHQGDHQEGKGSVSHQQLSIRGLLG